MDVSVENIVEEVKDVTKQNIINGTNNLSDLKKIAEEYVSEMESLENLEAKLRPKFASQNNNDKENFVEKFKNLYSSEIFPEDVSVESFKDVFVKDKKTKTQKLFATAQAQAARTAIIRKEMILTIRFAKTVAAFRDNSTIHFTYVYTSKGEVKTYTMNYEILAKVIDASGGISEAAVLKEWEKLKNDETLEKETLEDSLENKKHVDYAQAALFGTTARLQRYYGQKGSNRKGGPGRLLYKTNHVWVIVWVNSMGDVKEAYVSALLTEHDSGSDLLCKTQDRGTEKYYSDALIARFYGSYLRNVTGTAAAREEDITIGKNQYAVKGKGANKPGFQQYKDLAKIIQLSTTKESLEGEIDRQFSEGKARNTIEGFITTTEEQGIEDILSSGKTFYNTFKDNKKISEKVYLKY